MKIRIQYFNLTYIHETFSNYSETFLLNASTNFITAKLSDAVLSTLKLTRVGKIHQKIILGSKDKFIL